MVLAPPGWYDDPEGGSTQRYWDGNEWEPRGSDPTQPQPADDPSPNQRIEITLDDLTEEPGPIPASEPTPADVPTTTVSVHLDSDTVGPPAAAAVAHTPVVPPPDPAPGDLSTGRRRLVALLVVLAVVLLGGGFVAALALSSNDAEDARSESSGEGAASTTPPTPSSTAPASPAPVPVPAPTPAPTVTTAPSPSFEIGDAFSADCVVAWPSAPVRDSTTIQMTMTCSGVPNEFQFVQVVYPDPELDVTPSTGSMHVSGQVTDFAQSQLGFQVLVVVAEEIDL